MAYVNSEYETASMPTGTYKREQVIPIPPKQIGKIISQISHPANFSNYV